MITSIDAVTTIERMIECIPDDKEKFGLIVSLDVAQALYNYVYDMTGGAKLRLAVKGEEFTYKGVRCIVG